MKNVISMLGEIKHNPCSTSCKPIDVISISSDDDNSVDENITYSVIQEQPIRIKKNMEKIKKILYILMMVKL